jgi:hypothetical protein
MVVTFSNFSSGEPFDVRLDTLTGVEEYEEGGSLVQRGHGSYYMVRESVLEVMRLCVAAADRDQGQQQDSNVS